MLRTLVCAIALVAISAPALADIASPVPKSIGSMSPSHMKGHMSGSMSKDHMKGAMGKNTMKTSSSKMKGGHMGSSMMHASPAPH